MTPQDRFKRYGKSRAECFFKFTDRSGDPTQRGHQSVAVCGGCKAFAVFGTTKEIGRELWQRHIAGVKAGITPEPRLHQ